MTRFALLFLAVGAAVALVSPAAAAGACSDEGDVLYRYART